MAEHISQKLELLGLATGVQPKFQFPNSFSDPSVQVRTHVDRWKTTNPQTSLWIHRLGYTLLNEHEKLSEATGDTHSGPPVAYCSCWGKAYRSVPPSLPRGVRGWGVI